MLYICINTTQRNKLKYFCLHHHKIMLKDLVLMNPGEAFKFDK